jgi:hypothetical protein
MVSAGYLGQSTDGTGLSRPAEQQGKLLPIAGRCRAYCPSSKEFQIWRLPRDAAGPQDRCDLVCPDLPKVL